MKKTMSMSEAYTVARFFAAMDRQINIAWTHGRDADALSMARLVGALHVRIFGWAHSPFDNPAYEVAA